MKLKKLVALTLLAASVSACATVDTATRNAPMDTTQLAAPQVAVAPRNYRIQAFHFVAPSDLRVSEANSYYPIADIVWRGDPLGDRREQIAGIFNASINAATPNVTGSTPVIVDVTLHRFHSVTERTRYTVGGTHSIKFDLTVRNAETGAVLEGPHFISADIPALGGRAAIAAEQQGQTQKVRVTSHLAAVFTDFLTGVPGQETTAETIAAGS